MPRGPTDYPSRMPALVIDGTVMPTAGPANISVKEVVMTADEARREVIRLNTLIAGHMLMLEQKKRPTNK